MSATLAATFCSPRIVAERTGLWRRAAGTAHRWRPLGDAHRRYRTGDGTLPYFGSHRVRHGVATNLINKGMALEEVSAFLAHSSIGPTKRYAKQTAASLGERAAEALQRSGVMGNLRRRRAG